MEELKISIQDKKEIEKFILINVIGLMDSLKDGLVTIDECEVYLYSPYSIKKLSDLKIDNNIIDLIEEGCELEDIESLVPEKLDNAIDSIKKKASRLLSELSKKETEKKKWID